MTTEASRSLDDADMKTDCYRNCTHNVYAVCLSTSYDTDMQELSTSTISTGTRPLQQSRTTQVALSELTQSHLLVRAHKACA